MNSPLVGQISPYETVKVKSLLCQENHDRFRWVWGLPSQKERMGSCRYGSQCRRGPWIFCSCLVTTCSMFGVHDFDLKTESRIHGSNWSSRPKSINQSQWIGHSTIAFLSVASSLGIEPGREQSARWCFLSWLHRFILGSHQFPRKNPPCSSHVIPNLLYLWGNRIHPYSKIASSCLMVKSPKSMMDGSSSNIHSWW